MAEQTVIEFLDVLAEKYIPEGTHELLHVDSRQAWIKLMTNLIEGGMVVKKLSLLTNCAEKWETLLAQKYSMQN